MESQYKGVPSVHHFCQRRCAASGALVVRQSSQLTRPRCPQAALTTEMFHFPLLLPSSGLTSAFGLRLKQSVLCSPAVLQREDDHRLPPFSKLGNTSVFDVSQKLGPMSQLSVDTHCPPSPWHSGSPFLGTASPRSPCPHV